MRTSIKYKIRTHLAACALAGVAFSGSALGAIIHSGTVNLAIPVTTNGLYLNVVTAANNLPGSTNGTTVPGWDVNVWSSTGLGFFSPSLPAGGTYVLSAASTTGNIAPGTSIDSGSSFGSGNSGNTSQWVVNSSNNLFGFRFQNEVTGQVHYGWARIQLGATPIDAARALVEYAYEDAPGVAIAAGDDGTPTGSPSIGFTSGTLAFGNVTVGSTSGVQTATLANTGSASGVIPSLTSSNAAFAITGGTCGAAPITLAAGANCTVTMTFTPAAAGAASGSLTFGAVPNNTPSGSAEVALSGTGEPAGAANIAFSTSTLDFGSVQVGNTSATQTVTLANSGNASGTVPTLTSSNAAFAITGGTCGAAPITLAAGANCTVTMTFSPAAVGPTTGTLDGGTDLSVALSGNGTEVPTGGAEPVVATVPANSPWALAALLGLFGLIAGAMLRRR